MIAFKSIKLLCSFPAQTGSVYSVIAVTVERYIAVCHPLYARSICTWSRAKYYTISVLLFSTIYNLPRWGEFVTVSTDPETGSVRNEMTELRCNTTYITVYVQWCNFVVMILLPIILLVVLNAIIFLEVGSCSILCSKHSRSFPLNMAYF